MIGEYVRVPELVISALLGVTFAAGCSQRAPLKEVHSASHTLTPAGTIELIDDAALVGGVWMSILDDRNELAVTLLRRDTITESELQVRRFALHAPADASQAFSLGGFGYEFSSGGTRPTSDGAQLHYDGQRLLTLVPRWQPSEGQLSVVNALSGDILQVLDWDANTHVYRYAFSPDSTLVAVCGGHPSRHDQGRVMVWELTSGRLILKGENSERAFFTLSFSQDAQLLAAGTYRRDSQDMVYVYGTATRLIRYTLSHPDMMCPWFTPSGLLLTVPVPGSTTWSVWDVSRGEQVNSVSVPLKSGPWGISDIEFRVFRRIRGFRAGCGVRFGGMAGQMNAEGGRGSGRGVRPEPGWAFTRPDLVIPCRVARQQSPTPFHQAAASIARETL
jgi:hypothetical protein